jgi:hypothetical protein
MKVWISIVAALLMCVTLSVAEASRIEETFNDDPVEHGRATVNGDNKSRDTSGNEADAFSFQSAGKMVQNLNTNWNYDKYDPFTGTRGQGEGSRLEFDLGQSYSQNDSFSFGATLTIKSAGFTAESDQMMAISFGLMNSLTTGMDRTGAYDGDAYNSERDTFDSIEWNFFPNESAFGWPTLQQTVFGSQLGDENSMFSHFAANFGEDEVAGYDTILAQEKANPDHPLYENYYGLPLEVPMSITMAYNGATKTVSMLVTDAGSGEVLVDNISTLPDLDITAPIGGYGSVSHFSVDTLAITNYQDGRASGGPTLVAKIEYEVVWFEEAQAAAVSEPTALTVLLLGVFGLRQRRRS